MSDTFILELPLKMTRKDEKKILARFEAARQVWNAVLGEGLKRLDLLWQSKAYRRALKMPRGGKDRQATTKQRDEYRARIKAFQKAEAAAKTRKYDLNHWATQFTHSWIRDHLGSQEVKAIVKHIIVAINAYRFGTNRPCKKRGYCTKKKKNCHVCGRPRFKRYGTVKSVENITNLQGLRWRDPGPCRSEAGSEFYVQWRDLKLPAVVDLNDPVQMHGLSSRVKYVRVIQKVIKSRDRYFVQLVLEGRPLQQGPVAHGCVVGLDIGPSTIAAFSLTKVFLVQFCAELGDIERETRCLQRKIDRQRRVNNPDCYDDKGRAIKGKRPRNRSNRMRKTEARLVELRRRDKAYRKSLHGKLANEIIAMGNVVKTEKLSYKAFQKLWGKSVGKRAPGMFMDTLRRKAESSDGEFHELSTYQTRLSQTCHGCGVIEKKGLSVRWHRCDCGIEAQRDLYSAFLAYCVDDGSLNADLVRELWDQGAGSLLQTAFRETQSANRGRKAPASFGLAQSQSGSS